MKTNEHGVHFCEFVPPQETKIIIMPKLPNSTTISVKKLVYMEHDNPNGADYYTGTAQNYKIEECGLRRFWVSRTDLNCKEPFLVYDSLQEATNHVQKCWDEYVLSLVEVNNEN